MTLTTVSTTVLYCDVTLRLTVFEIFALKWLLDTQEPTPSPSLDLTFGDP